MRKQGSARRRKAAAVRYETTKEKREAPGTLIARRLQNAAIAETRHEEERGTVMKENIVKLTPDSIDVTSYPDMQELLLVADVLITDYSTIIYDMAIMRKVILLYAPDLDDYKNNRGLKPIYFNLPSRINQSNDELMEYICRLDLDEYKKRLDEFLSHVQIFDDGKASQRVVERIKSVV